MTWTERFPFWPDIRTRNGNTRTAHGSSWPAVVILTVFVTAVQSEPSSAISFSFYTSYNYVQSLLITLGKNLLCARSVWSDRAAPSSSYTQQQLIMPNKHTTLFLPLSSSLFPLLYSSIFSSQLAISLMHACTNSMNDHSVLFLRECK